MYEASLTGVVRTVLIILLIYFGLKIIFRWLGPVILKYIMKKVGQKVSNSFNQQRGFNSEEEEGKVTLEKKPTQRKSNKEVGEYIDYEEID